MSKNLFHINPEQNKMHDAYTEMLKEEQENGTGNTASWFEDILVESSTTIIPEDAVTRNEDGTIRIMMESITAEQWEVMKKHIVV